MTRLIFALASVIFVVDVLTPIDGARAVIFIGVVPLLAPFGSPSDHSRRLRNEVGHCCRSRRWTCG